MPSIFDKLSKALLGGEKQPPSSSSDSSRSEQSIGSNSSEESHPSVEVEDAMSLGSFRKIAEETDTRLRDASEVPIQLLKNYLRDINKDEDRTTSADQLLKELQSVHDSYKENLDRALVSRVITALQPYASEKIKDGITYCRPYSIPLRKATLLPTLFENFREAFRCEEQKPTDEIKQDTATRFRR